MLRYVKEASLQILANENKASGLYPGFAEPYAVPGAQSFQTSPPKYPSPWMDGSGGWEDAYQKAQAFVRQLTLTEKVNLTTGVGWEGMFTTDAKVFDPPLLTLGKVTNASATLEAFLVLVSERCVCRTVLLVSVMPTSSLLSLLVLLVWLLLFYFPLLFTEFVEQLLPVGIAPCATKEEGVWARQVYYPGVCI